MKKRDSFDTQLGLDEEEKPVIELENINITSKGSKDDIKEDYEKLRESLVGSLIRSQEVIDHVTIEIKQGSSAMMVQSLAQLIKGLGDTTKALLELHNQTRKLEPKVENDVPSEKKTIKTNINDIIDFANEKEKRMSNV